MCIMIIRHANECRVTTRWLLSWGVGGVRKAALAGLLIDWRGELAGCPIKNPEMNVVRSAWPTLLNSAEN